MQKIIQHDDLSTPIYNQIKKLIESGELLPGQKLIQEKLAAALGVSRTPLLKALQKLEHEMLVESIPRKGMYVKKISKQEMIYVYECREALECMAIRLLIDRATDSELSQLKEIFEPFLQDVKIDVAEYGKADERFHNMIINLSQNPMLNKMSNVSNIHTKVYQFGLVRPPEKTLTEHGRIVEAILKRDKETAVRELRNHISMSREQINKLPNK